MPTEVQHEWLSDVQVAARFSVCRQTVWRWVQLKRFPSPVRVGQRAQRWRLSDIEQHERELQGGGAA